MWGECRGPHHRQSPSSKGLLPETVGTYSIQGISAVLTATKAPLYCGTGTADPEMPRLFNRLKAVCAPHKERPYGIRGSNRTTPGYHSKRCSIRRLQAAGNWSNKYREIGDENGGMPRQIDGICMPIPPMGGDRQQSPCLSCYTTYTVHLSSYAELEF